MAPRSVRFSPETEAALVAHAAELDRPVSWVVQRAVEAFLGGAVGSAEPGPSELEQVVRTGRVPASRGVRNPLADRQAALNRGKGL